MRWLAIIVAVIVGALLLRTLNAERCAESAGSGKPAVEGRRLIAAKPAGATNAADAAAPAGACCPPVATSHRRWQRRQLPLPQPDQPRPTRPSPAEAPAAAPSERGPAPVLPTPKLPPSPLEKQQ